jgi:hypothetical protein
MRIRHLQHRDNRAAGWSVEYTWHDYSAAHCRTRLRMAYRFARRNGCSPMIARHLMTDLLLLGAEAKEYRHIKPVNS